MEQVSEGGRGTNSTLEMISSVEALKLEKPPTTTCPDAGIYCQLEVEGSTLNMIVKLWLQ